MKKILKYLLKIHIKFLSYFEFIIYEKKYKTKKLIIHKFEKNINKIIFFFWIKKNKIIKIFKY
jgi:hypothetical protein